MPITYDSSTNTIVVVGGNETNPYTFEDIYQADQANGWGVVEKKETAYFIHAIIQLGDGDNDAWLVDKGKQLFFYADADYAFKNSAKTGHLILGEIENEEEKTTKNGCYVECHQDSFSTNIKELNLLDTMMVSKSDRMSVIAATGCIGKIWNSKFQNFRFAGIAQHLDMYNIEFKQGYCPFESFGVGSGNMEKITVMDVNYAVMFFRLYSLIIKELTAKSINNALVQFFLAMGNSYAIDWDVDWNADVLEGFTFGDAKLWRQYSFNVRVQDERNTPIPNARVILKDNYSNTVYSETTDESGRTPTQVLNWGYYTLDGNGNCVEYLSTPHTLTVTKQGYKKYEAKIELIKKLIDFPVILEKENINIDQEVLL